MISPFTGGNATLKHEIRTLEYRKEKFNYVAQFYEDDETHEQFTTTEMDETNIAQVYNQYRVKHSIPFEDEIIALRKTYNLSALKMSAILGFGDNQYRQYEEGYIPTESNGKILKACQNPLIFKTFVENSRNQLSEKEYAKIIATVEAVSQKATDVRLQLIYGDCGRCALNGYAPQSLERLHNILRFFINKCGGVFNTKMNKLLFYADFYNYRQHGLGITGLSYKAIKYGPVPVRWDRVYSLFDDIHQEIVEFNQDVAGTRLTTEQEADLTALSETERASLDLIFNAFEKMSAKEISSISHDEEAWRKCVGKQDLIDFGLAFELKAV